MVWSSESVAREDSPEALQPVLVPDRACGGLSLALAASMALLPKTQKHRNGNREYDPHLIKLRTKVPVRVLALETPEDFAVLGMSWADFHREWEKPSSKKGQKSCGQMIFRALHAINERSREPLAEGVVVPNVRCPGQYNLNFLGQAVVRAKLQVVSNSRFSK